MTPDPGSGAVRLASYNIHGCVGGDGRREPARILRVLEQLDADVVALQEVHGSEGSDDVLRSFADALGCAAVAGPTLRRGRGSYGNALLSRWPVLGVEQVDLSVPGREPRGAIDARIDLDGQTARVMATHLGLRPGERRAQIRRILDRLDFDDGLTVLMGDLNEWFLWGRPLRYLHRAFARTPARPTWPARLPLVALDRIWVRPRRRLRDLRTFREAPAQVASDHLPVVATVG